MSNRESAIGNERLDEWFLARAEEASCMPSDEYKSRYQQVVHELRRIQQEAGEGAILEQVRSGTASWDDFVYLTKHGPEHCEAVIGRVTELIRASQVTISPYEAYLLLFAIHLHDAGIALGRQKHWERCAKIMRDLHVAGSEECEKKTIVQIAQAHGRESDGNPDTILTLLPEPEFVLLEQKVRPQVLAALLRLADELAEGRNRACRFLLGQGSVPPESILCHEYSKSLHSVTLDGAEIVLRFDMSQATALQLFAKGGENLYLLDEIFSRTVKLHCERRYCIRFLRPQLWLDRVRVHIDIYSTDGLYRDLKKIGYTLAERGYPEERARDIHDLCPDLAGVSGDAVAAEIRGLLEAADEEVPGA